MRTKHTALALLIIVAGCTQLHGVRPEPQVEDQTYTEDQPEKRIVVIKKHTNCPKAHRFAPDSIAAMRREDLNWLIDVNQFLRYDCK